MDAQSPFADTDDGESLVGQVGIGAGCDLDAEVNPHPCDMGGDGDPIVSDRHLLLGDPGNLRLVVHVTNTALPGVHQIARHHRMSVRVRVVLALSVRQPDLALVGHHRLRLLPQERQSRTEIVADHQHGPSGVNDGRTENAPEATGAKPRKLQSFGRITISPADDL